MNYHTEFSQNVNKPLKISKQSSVTNAKALTADTHTDLCTHILPTSPEHMGHKHIQLFLVAFIPLFTYTLHTFLP